MKYDVIDDILYFLNKEGELSDRDIRMMGLMCQAFCVYRETKENLTEKK